jgi:beta-phosphoglucomutase family hydrolase
MIGMFYLPRRGSTRRRDARRRRIRKRCGRGITLLEVKVRENSHEDMADNAGTSRAGLNGPGDAGLASAGNPAGPDRSLTLSAAPVVPAPDAGRVPQSGPATPVLDLPAGITACLFDLDGVLTQTAKVHAAAWKEMFDAFLREWSERAGTAYCPFLLPDDYTAHVDGKLRTDGVRAFLASRGIVLPEGSPADPPTAQTVHGLGTRKNDLVLALLRQHGVEVYPGAVRFVEAARDAGLRRAVVSASKNCREVLVAAGIADLFEARVDGLVAEAAGLRGKPAPDTFLAAAARLGVAPERSAVFEDAVAGVEAGRAGRFGWVVGVACGAQAVALRQAGAHTVVGDLGELLRER